MIDFIFSILRMRHNFRVFKAVVIFALIGGFLIYKGVPETKFSSSFSERHTIEYKVDNIIRCDKNTLKEMENLEENDNILEYRSCSSETCPLVKATFWSSGFDSFVYFEDDGFNTCIRREVSYTNVKDTKFYTGKITFGKPFLESIGVPKGPMKSKNMLGKTNRNGKNSKWTKYGKVSSSGTFVGNYFVTIKYDAKPTNDTISLFGIPVEFSYLPSDLESEQSNE